MELLSTLGYLFCMTVISALCLIAGYVLLYLIYFRLWIVSTTTVYKGDEDMSGKTVLITGATSGIGKETALDLARRNARILMACRNLDKARKVAEEIKAWTGNANVIVKQLDLASFKSVRECAQDILNTEDQLHVLINNAGIASTMEPAQTEDGCEMVMQSNFLGHFLFTLLLLNLLRKSAPSRIINVASTYHRYATLNHQNLKNFASFKAFTPLERYGNSNLARILITKKLSEKLIDTGVTVNALHPGYVKTNIFKGGHILEIIIRYLVFFTGKTCEEGAQTTIRLAVDPSLEKISGKYFEECKIAKLPDKAKDEEFCRRLFELSERTVGVFFS